MDYLIEHFRKDIDCFFNTEPPGITLHMHNHMELYLLTKGEARFFIDNKSFLLEKGSLIFINNDQVHGPNPFPGEIFERCAIHFSPNLARSLSSNKTNLLQAFEERKSIVQLNPAQLDIMAPTMLKLISEFQHPSTIGHDLLLYSLFMQVLVYANQFSEPTKAEETYHFPELTTKILEYIQTQVSNPKLSLESVACQMNHNKIYLNRIFKEDLGVTIYQYILLSRISLAKRLLEENISVQQCCEKCGFNDYSNFIRAFKRITGISPKKYASSLNA
ncbi:AraC-like DNA-binding protein [Enterococcus sp. PF1-24]|uniref:AraC family transcriptional regulator n=1 Tax=unclassified Enterococcus TaxID=2608891 RepID=UPI002474E8D7|nr:MULTISPECIES: AraC family transcriptional regulator [unclassified Enterococcus]MDH6363976.1 AraC-like DNA-binding protein [Enterococcus sp. PFB1-1]MDH6401077.1 AraC-like DNA-binding protein [Enterococcus sp. PF1-24]